MEVDLPWEKLKWFDDEWVQLPQFHPSWEGWKEEDHSELNELKQRIDELEREGTWELRKKLANPFELVFTYEDDQIPQSLALIKPLSRSYFKMIEMLSVTDFLRQHKKCKKFRTTHVCEGPGGFIQAFLDVMGREQKTVDLCLAMTLRPTHLQIPGWKRASQFLRKHPEVKIWYGLDGTGDIYSLENQESFRQQLGEEKSQLFTADGGFDFKTDYIRQEQTAFRLIVASFSMAFQSLAKGGVCIIKLFDTFGTPTQQLIAYVSSFFRKWTLYKPAMSRPCNSERYFIGTQFRGSTEQSDVFLRELQNQLQNHPISDLESLFPEDAKLFPESLNAIQRSQMEFEVEQRKVLKKAIELNIDESEQIWERSRKQSEKWCRQFQITTRTLHESAALQRNQRHVVPQ